jgi:hypothetical protein
VGFTLGWHFQGKWVWRKQQEMEQLVLGRTEDGFPTDGRKTHNCIRAKEWGCGLLCTFVMLIVVF